jgi:hypothetical protein
VYRVVLRHVGTWAPRTYDATTLIYQIGRIAHIALGLRGL